MAKGKYHEWLEPDNLIRLAGWARDGLTDEQIAEKMGIVVGTFYDWKNRYPEISEALKKNKEIVDREVENALFKSAMGYFVEETTEHLKWDKTKGEYVMMVTKREKRYIPPSQTAQIFWLKNRKVSEWRDKREVDASEETIDKLKDMFEKMGGAE